MHQHYIFFNVRKGGLRFTHFSGHCIYLNDEGSVLLKHIVVLVIKSWETRSCGELVGTDWKSLRLMTLNFQKLDATLILPHSISVPSFFDSSQFIYLFIYAYLSSNLKFI
jgi:hypothetical protein